MKLIGRPEEVDMNTLSPASENGGEGANKSQSNTKIRDVGQAKYKYKWHWHILFVHFPISAFLGSFGFMVLHLITQTDCFELSTFVALILGAVVMIPTTVTGWTTWKKSYKGYRSKIFLSKIRISFAMIAISVALVLYRAIFVTEVIDLHHEI